MSIVCLSKFCVIHFDMANFLVIQKIHVYNKAGEMSPVNSSNCLIVIEYIDGDRIVLRLLLPCIHYLIQLVKVLKSGVVFLVLFS